MTIKKITLLDCTLRDGGYYNNWNFKKSFINEYLKIMSNLKVDVVEIGFKSLNSSVKKGRLFYSDEKYINSLNIPKNLIISVMINASIIDEKYLGFELKKLFVEKKNSKINIVRIASHLNEIDKSLKIASWLKKRGYFVGLNLMQISKYSPINIKEILIKTKRDCIDVVYFADSTGSINNQDIGKIILNIKKKWKKEIGIHAHNNLNQALSNSIYAIQNGVNWVDGTLTGMGRGAGNAQIEYFLLERDKYLTNSNVSNLADFIKNKMEPLKKKYNWETNIFYYLSGLNKIHPTYIQTMLANNFSSNKILENINYLKKIKSQKFDIKLINSSLESNLKYSKGDWFPQNILKNKDILLIANGPSIKQNKDQITKFIIKKKPVVFSLNTECMINSKYISFFLACHPFRVKSDYFKYYKLNKKLIYPHSIYKLKSLKKFLNFGVGVKQNTFEIFDNGAILPTLNVMAYALSICASGKRTM